MFQLRHKVLEVELRAELTKRGYDGRDVNFVELELIGIERPGWVQIYDFEATGFTLDGENCHLWGVVKDDQRSEQTVEIFNSKEGRQPRIDELCAGLHTRKRRPISKTEQRLVTLVLLVLGCAVVIELFRSMFGVVE